MRRGLDALLVLPPMYHSGRIPDYNPKEPMGLMYLAAELRRRGLEVEILDAAMRALTIEETVGEIVARPAAVIGFSVLQRALPSLELIVGALRERGVRGHVCCGGVGATLSAVSVLNRVPGVDSVVLGDGELTFSDLVGRIVCGAGWRDLPGLYRRGYRGDGFTGRAVKPELDLLSPPVRDLLPFCLERAGHSTVVGSRGCYAACSFCSNRGYERMTCGPGWRGRDPAAIVDEIECLHREFGVPAIKFNDPNLFGPGAAGRAHVHAICGELIRRGLNHLHLLAFTRASDLDAESCALMRRAGFERILIGIETFDARALKMLRKGETPGQMLKGIGHLRRAGISIVPGFIIFNPYSTLETIRKDLDLLDEHRFTAILSKAMRVFDGTALMDDMAEAGRLIRRNPFDGYHEYVVDRDVAAAYICVKTVAVEWLAPLMSRYQDRIWEIKKAPSFNGRKEFYSFQGAVYRVESQVLRAAIHLLQEGHSRDAIIRLLERIKDEIKGMENVMIRERGMPRDGEIVPNLSVTALADRLSGIVLSRPYDTFPERYRWADD